jgi:hypothetical protein
VPGMGGEVQALGLEPLRQAGRHRRTADQQE